MKKVFIVEDERSIAEGIATQLKNWNLDIHIIEHFNCVIEEFEQYQPDLVLMDIILPFFDGYHWCQQIRKISSVPVVFISSASENMNIVMAMNMGGDDFIVKPFDNSVMVAKIMAVLRRSYDYKQFEQMIEHRGLSLNISNNTAEYQQQKIELTKNEYRILLVLLQNRGKVVSRDMLMNELWKTDVYVDENTLTVNVSRLRKKLELYGLCEYIKTKSGVGYIVE